MEILNYVLSSLCYIASIIAIGAFVVLIAVVIQEMTKR